MENFIIIAVVLIIVVGVSVYIIKSKKSGKKCIGCPESSKCGGNCAGCGYDKKQ